MRRSTLGRSRVARPRMETLSERKRRASFGAGRSLQFGNRHGNDVRLSPGCRDPNCAGRKLEDRREQVADNGHHAAAAIEYGRARGAVIEDETVVAVVELEQCQACEFAAIAVL